MHKGIKSFLNEEGIVDVEDNKVVFNIPNMYQFVLELYHIFYNDKAATNFILNKDNWIDHENI